MNVWKLLDADQWAALSAIGTVASAVIALFGLGFIGVQIRAARKSADLQSLQEFLRAATERETHLLEAGSPDQKEKAFFEFANFLEMQAAALHGGLFPRVTRTLVREKIRDSIAFIELADLWSEKLRQGRSSPTALEHLYRFMKKERRRINAVKADYQASLAKAAPVELDHTAPAGDAEP